jgi:RNA polymerase sigma factor (sigma-70 family)
VTSAPAVRPTSAFASSSFSFPPSPSRCPWEDLVRRFEPDLRARVRRALWSAGVLPGPEQVDDLLQEVYCRLLANGGRRLRLFRGEGEEEMSAYLGRIAERVVADQMRTTRTLKRGRGRLLVFGPAAGEDAVARAVDPRGTPEDQLLAAERHRHFRAVCQRLLPGPTAARDTRVLELALLGGWSSREIARALGGRLAPSSVDSLVYRLRRRLAQSGIAVPKRDCRPARPADAGDARRGGR